VDPIANPYRPAAASAARRSRRSPAPADSFEVVRQRAETYGEGDRSWILKRPPRRGQDGAPERALTRSRTRLISASRGQLARALPVVLPRHSCRRCGPPPVATPCRSCADCSASSRRSRLKVDPALGLVSLGAEVEPGQRGGRLGPLRRPDRPPAGAGETSADLGIGRYCSSTSCRRPRPTSSPRSTMRSTSSARDRRHCP